MGQPVWDEVPGEFRNMLRRLVVTQGDTEPASVEQQRDLGATAPSLYDLRNLFQVNVEEGRHLWAMVYLLHTYFGRDGREEAEELLQRRSGDADKPRILGAFNEPTSHWLSFFMFTMFTDRDGKYQLAALAESGFDPLARTCRFMLTEEAHHMFVGETGVQRVVKRACELMKQDRTATSRALGGVDLPTIQKYLNLWYSLSLDLFGGEVSSNAADAFAAGLKGRYKEDRYDEHKLIGSHFAMDVLEDGKVVHKDVADAQRAQRGAAHRVHQGLPARRRSLEQDDQGRGHRRSSSSCRRTSSTARSACGAATASRPTARCSIRRRGTRAAASGCRTTPTRRTSRA